MNDPTLTAAITAFLTALSGYLVTVTKRQKKAKKDLDAVFPKVRALEERVAKLETGGSGDDAPRCLLDCQRKEA